MKYLTIYENNNLKIINISIFLIVKKVNIDR